MRDAGYPRGDRQTDRFTARAQTPESGLFTEGSFVLVDGDYGYDSVFKVAEIGHPPSERRDEAM